jgi:hypothetical protein
MCKMSNKCFISIDTNIYLNYDNNERRDIMSFILRNKAAIVLYLFIIGGIYLLSLRVESLESKEDYYKYNEQIVVNLQR